MLMDAENSMMIKVDMNLFQPLIVWFWMALVTKLIDLIIIIIIIIDLKCTENITCIYQDV